MKFDIGDLLQKFKPGAKIWCYDNGNKQYYENIIDHVDMNISVTIDGIKNRFGFLMVYYKHRYNGKYKGDVCWVSEDSLIKNEQEVSK